MTPVELEAHGRRTENIPEENQHRRELTVNGLITLIYSMCLFSCHFNYTSHMGVLIYGLTASNKCTKCSVFVGLNFPAAATVRLRS